MIYFCVFCEFSDCMMNLGIYKLGSVVQSVQMGQGCLEEQKV